MAQIYSVSGDLCLKLRLGLCTFSLACIRMSMIEQTVSVAYM